MCIYIYINCFSGCSNLQYYCSGIDASFVSMAVPSGLPHLASLRFFTLCPEEAENALMRCPCARVASHNIHGSTLMIWWRARCVHGSQCWGLEERVDVTHVASYSCHGVLFNKQFKKHHAGSEIISIIVHWADDMRFQYGVNPASKAQESFRDSLDCLRILHQRTF